MCALRSRLVGIGSLRLMKPHGTACDRQSSQSHPWDLGWDGGPEKGYEPLHEPLTDVCADLAFAPEGPPPAQTATEVVRTDLAPNARPVRISRVSSYARNCLERALGSSHADCCRCSGLMSGLDYKSRTSSLSLRSFSSCFSLFFWLVTLCHIVTRERSKTCASSRGPPG